MENLKISKPLFLNLLQFAQQRGISNDVIERYLGGSIQQISEQDNTEMIPLRYQVSLYELLVNKLGDPIVGLHVGELYNVAAMGIVGQLIQNCRTLQQALEKSIEYFNLISNGFEMIMKHEPDSFRLIFRLDQGLQQLHPVGSHQLILGSMVYAYKEIYYLTGKHIEPTAAAIVFDAESTEMLRLLGKQPAVNAKENYLSFNNEILQTPITHSDYELLMILEQVACDRMSVQQSDNMVFTHQIERMIYSLIDPAFPSIQEIASNLNTTPRSIQRKLKDEHTSYATILEKIKKELAVTYLKKDLSIKEVSYLMGYAEPSSFVSAFKKWFGHTPVKYKSLL